MRHVLGSVMVIGALLAVRPVAAEDWTTAYAGLGRTSYLAGEALAPPFAVAWDTTLPGAMKGAPLVAFGHAYLSDVQLHVWCVTTADGAIVWKHDEARDPAEVRCYDALTGGLRWTARVDGNLIHTPQIGQTAVYVSTSTGHLYAFNQADGHRLWESSVGSPLTLPAVDGTLVVVGSGSELVGLNAPDGVAVFLTDLGSPITSVPVLAADGAYVALAGQVVSVDRAGQPRWRATLDKPAQAPIAVTKAGVLAASVDGSVRLLDRTTGQTVWTTLLAGTPNTVSGAGEVVYVGTRQGTVVGLRLADGAKLWSAALEHGAIDGVALSGGRVMVVAGPWVGSLLPAPEAPTDVALAAAGNRGTLSWTAPAANGSVVTGYRVWRRRGATFAAVGTVGANAFADSLLPGDVGYAVSAIAANGAESVRSAEVTARRGEPLIRRLAAGPMPYDSRSGNLLVSLEVRAAARVTWTIRDAEGNALTDPATLLVPAGPTTFAWDGRNRGGQPADPGVYRVAVTASAAEGDDAQAKAFPVGWDAGTGGGSPLAGPAGVGAGGAGPQLAAAGTPGGSAGSPPPGSAGGNGAEAGGADAGPHDNGWHNGNNPNGFVINHDDKSQGNGNNHH